MNRDDRDIDILLRRNVERQLEGFDWEALRQGIDGRLASAGAPTRSWRRYGTWGAMAATVTLTAGLIVLAVIRGSGSGPRDSVPGQAKVVMIETAHATGKAQVSLLPVEKRGQCEVRIHPSDKPRREGGAQASWCIVVGQHSLTERRSGGRDASDVVCLF